jgi:hypothetical protein
MEYIIVLLVLLTIITAFAVNWWMHQGNPFPLTKKSQLLTPVERSFLGLLEHAVGDEYKIMNRIKLADVLEVQPKADARARRAALQKLNAKYLDYVLCDPVDMSIVAVVDLVNNTDKTGHKAVPDWFVSGALEASGIPYIRMKIKAGYDVADIKQVIAKKVGKSWMKPEPLVKGFVKKGPTRPLKPLENNVVPANLKPTTALIQLS